jgi:hypothetical protein
MMDFFLFKPSSMIFLDYSYVIYLLSDTLFLLANVRVCFGECVFV